MVNKLLSFMYTRTSILHQNIKGKSDLATHDIPRGVGVWTNEDSFKFMRFTYTYKGIWNPEVLDQIISLTIDSGK